MLSWIKWLVGPSRVEKMNSLRDAAYVCLNGPLGS